MKDEADKISEYLLGELSDKETEDLEERFFVDDQLFADVQAGEMTLIDRYVRNAMSVDERDQFEQKFLVTPERLAKVDESRAFHSELRILRAGQDQAESEASVPFLKRLFGGFGFSLPAMQYASAALILAMVLGMGWLIYDGWTMRQELLTAQTRQRELETSLNEQLARKEQELQDKLLQQSNSEAETLSALEDEIETLRSQLDEARRKPEGNATTPPPSRVPTIATFVFTGTRGNETPVEIELGKEVKVLNLRMPLVAAEKEVFEVTITRGSSVVLKVSDVKPRSNVLSLSIPARNLLSERHDVLIRNKAGEEMTKSFIVKRK